jgi:hypothetical protein
MQNSKFQSQAEYHKDQDKKRQPETDEYSGEIEIEG